MTAKQQNAFELSKAKEQIKKALADYADATGMHITNVSVTWHDVGPVFSGLPMAPDALITITN